MDNNKKTKLAVRMNNLFTNDRQGFYRFCSGYLQALRDLGAWDDTEEFFELWDYISDEYFKEDQNV